MEQGSDLAFRTTEELVTALREESQRRRDNQRINRYGSAFLLTGLLALMVFLWAKRGAAPWEFLNAYGAFILVACGGVAVTARHRATLARASCDGRSAKFLIEALTYHDAQVIADAEETLAIGLANLSTLESSHRRILATRLVLTRNMGFAQAAVRVLARVGGSESLRGLEAFTERKLGGFAFERARALSHQAMADIRLRVAKASIENLQKPPTLVSHEPEDQHLRVG